MEVAPDAMIIHVEPSTLYFNVTVPSVVGEIVPAMVRVCP